tara:strand:+ start:31 stop:729 length:699 start_codon:yes stop_codon:yes gene_type:complete
MIDNNKWTNTLPKNDKIVAKENTIDPDIWINTISKKNEKESFKKYSLTLFLVIVGLVSVLVIKNESRILQKEIYDLKTDINSLETDLHQASLEYEVITSPENISLLAKKHLEYDLTYYNSSQIKQLNQKKEFLAKPVKSENKKISKKIKIKISKKIEQKKNEFKKIKELYKEPEKIPEEMKAGLTKIVEENKTKIKKIYKEPKDSINMKRITQWGTIQIVKVFLGIPVIPGK